MRFGFGGKSNDTDGRSGQGNRTADEPSRTSGPEAAREAIRATGSQAQPIPPSRMPIEDVPAASPSDGASADAAVSGGDRPAPMADNGRGSGDSGSGGRADAGGAGAGGAGAGGAGAGGAGAGGAGAGGAGAGGAGAGGAGAGGDLAADEEDFNWADAEPPESGPEISSEEAVELARDTRTAPREEDRDGESRVSVIKEAPPRPGPPDGADEDEYKWHTYRQYPSGRPDAVEFIDTYKAFGRNKILRGLNMGLPEGMVSMILGPSGTGKSVCIKHMVGLLYPDQGDILVQGESVPNMPDDDLFEMRKKFGLLFQDGALFGSMNLYDNVAFPLRQHTEKGEDEIEDIVGRRLTEVGLGHSRDKFPNELSGGMRKRAGFARALVLEPDIVLFDEPDSGLDPVRTSLLGELILEVHRDMMDDAKEQQKAHLPTFCVITHNVMMARRVSDYLNVLWKGRIVEAGPSEDMLSSDNPFIRQFLAGESMGPLTMD